jgi:hypothetical protein
MFQKLVIKLLLEILYLLINLDNTTHHTILTHTNEYKIIEEAQTWLKTK